MAKTAERNVPITDETVIVREGFNKRIHLGGLASSFGHHIQNPEDEQGLVNLAQRLGHTLMSYAVDPVAAGQSVDDWELISSASVIQVTHIQGFNFIAQVDGEKFLGIVEPYQQYSIYLRSFNQHAVSYTD